MLLLVTLQLHIFCNTNGNNYRVSKQQVHDLSSCGCLTNDKPLD